MVGLMLLMFMWMGLMLGAGADSAAEATIDVDEQIAEMDIGEPSEEPSDLREQGLGPLAPWSESLQTWNDRLSIETPLDPYIRAGVHELTEAMLRAALTVASWSAFVGYHYLRWVPAVVISGLAQLSMLAAVGYLLHDQLGTIRSLRETH